MSVENLGKRSPLQKAAICTEPLAVWGTSALSVSILAYAVARRRWLLLAKLTSVHWFLRHVPRKLVPSIVKQGWQSLLAYGMPLKVKYRLHTAEGILPRDVLVEPSDRKTRRRVIMCHPHGIYSVAIKRTLPESNRAVVLLDQTLVHLSPMVRASALMFGFQDALPLTNETVNAVMQQGTCDILVAAGGFVEAAAGTPEVNRLWFGKWPYWAHKCLKYDYDLAARIIHGGSQVFWQSDQGVAWRLSVAKRALPCVAHGLPCERHVPFVVDSFLEDTRSHAPSSSVNLKNACEELVVALALKVHLAISEVDFDSCAGCFVLPSKL